jgi:hypothetical protein
LLVVDSHGSTSDGSCAPLQAGDEEGGQADGGGGPEGGQAEQANDEEGGQAHDGDAAEGGHMDDDIRQDSDEDRQGIHTPSSDDFVSSQTSTLAEYSGPIPFMLVPDNYQLPQDQNLQGYVTPEDFGIGDKMSRHLALSQKSFVHIIPILHVQLGAGDRHPRETQAFLQLHRICLVNLLAAQELVGRQTSELSRLRLRRFILLVVVVVVLVACLPCIISIG